MNDNHTIKYCAEEPNLVRAQADEKPTISADVVPEGFAKHILYAALHESSGLAMSAL